LCLIGRIESLTLAGYERFVCEGLKMIEHESDIIGHMGDTRIIYP